jgi:NDP-sugar pyrophosphorylase family protein
VPKILAPLAGRTVLEHQLEYLARGGIEDVAVNAHHHAEAVVEFLGAHELPVRIRISVEPELLGTAGALEPLDDFITGPTVVLYGDVLTDADLGALVAAHADRRAAVTLAFYESSSLEGKGLLQLDRDRRIRGFIEKPDSPPPRANVNAGLCVISSAVLGYVRPGADLGRDVWPEMLTAGARLYGYPHRGYVRDLGSPEALEEAEADLAAGALRW